MKNIAGRTAAAVIMATVATTSCGQTDGHTDTDTDTDTGATTLTATGATALKAMAGDWAGITEIGSRLESRIVIEEDGRITATGCAYNASGIFNGNVLTDARVHGTKRRPYIHGQVGKPYWAFMPTRTGLTAVETGRSTTNHSELITVKTTLKRTRKLICAHRFTAKPLALPAGDTGIVGTWSATTDDGSISELAVLSVDKPDGLVGWLCLKSKATGIILVTDFYPGAPVTSSWDRHELIVERQATPTRRHRTVYSLTGGDRLRRNSIADYGTAHAHNYALEMKRGVHPDGCLRYLRPRTANGS